jgi:DNA-binding HxlR family transcriptional regulator
MIIMAEITLNKGVFRKKVLCTAQKDDTTLTIRGTRGFLSSSWIYEVRTEGPQGKSIITGTSFSLMEKTKGDATATELRATLTEVFKRVNDKLYTYAAYFSKAELYSLAALSHGKSRVYPIAHNSPVINPMLISRGLLRLNSMELVSREIVEDSGRNVSVYTMTPKGRTYHERLLEDPDFVEIQAKRDARLGQKTV